MECHKLIGRFEDEVDANGRVRLPEAWYSELREPNAVVLIPNAEGGIDLIPKGTFGVECDMLRRKAMSDPAMRRVLEILERKAERVEIDSSRSFRISDSLLGSAKIAGAVVFVGTGLRAKISSLALSDRR